MPTLPQRQSPRLDYYYLLFTAYYSPSQLYRNDGVLDSRISNETQWTIVSGSSLSIAGSSAVGQIAFVDADGKPTSTRTQHYDLLLTTYYMLLTTYYLLLTTHRDSTPALIQL